MPDLSRFPLFLLAPLVLVGLGCEQPTLTPTSTWQLVTRTAGTEVDFFTSLSDEVQEHPRQLNEIVAEALQVTDGSRSSRLSLVKAGDDAGQVTVGPLWVEKREEGFFLMSLNEATGDGRSGDPLGGPTTDIKECHRLAVEHLLEAMNW